MKAKQFLLSSAFFTSLVLSGHAHAASLGKLQHLSNPSMQAVYEAALGVSTGSAAGAYRVSD